MNKLILIFFLLGNVSLIKASNIYSQTPGSKKRFLTSKQVEFCISFLKWYSKNEKELESKPFFNTNANGDTTKVYSVNFENVDNYVNHLSNSGYVSKKFTHNIFILANNASNYLKVKPQRDGEIVDLENGLEYSIDPVIQLMEEGLLTDHLKTLKGKALYANNNCVVILTVSKDLSYVFVLTRQKHKWLIDSIEAKF